MYGELFYEDFSGATEFFEYLAKFVFNACIGKYTATEPLRQFGHFMQIFQSL